MDHDSLDFDLATVASASVLNTTIAVADRFVVTASGQFAYRLAGQAVLKRSAGLLLRGLARTWVHRPQAQIGRRAGATAGCQPGALRFPRWTGSRPGGCGGRGCIGRRLLIRSMMGSPVVTATSLALWRNDSEESGPSRSV